MIILKQSTAAVIKMGPFVDFEDGVTLEAGLATALDNATTGIKISKNGGTLAARHATVTETAYDAHGMYNVHLDATDTNTLTDLLVIYTDPATCLAHWQRCVVLPANVYDAMYGADLLDVELSSVLAAVEAIPANPLTDDDARLDCLDAEVSSRLAAVDYAAAPSAAAIKSALEANGSKIDHLWELTEDDGGVRRLTANALEQAPTGMGGSGSAVVVLPVMQGRVYSATAVQGRDVVVVQGDTPRVVFDLGADYSTWTPYVAAKANLEDAVYLIAPKAGAWSAPASGQGYVDLTAADTAAIGRHFAEIELRNGEARLTAMKFRLKIIDAVITE
jgi:hypothetical protein